LSEAKVIGGELVGPLQSGDSAWSYRRHARPRFERGKDARWSRSGRHL